MKREWGREPAITHLDPLSISKHAQLDLEEHSIARGVKVASSQFSLLKIFALEKMIHYYFPF